MGKNKNINGKQKQRLEEVPELEEGEEYYDYSDEEGYGLDMLDGEDNWAAGATAGQYDPWGAKPTAQQSAGGSQWGGMPQNTIPTPAQMAAHAAASGSKGGGGGGKKDKKGGGGKGSGAAWEGWGKDNYSQAPAPPVDAWGATDNWGGGGGGGDWGNGGGWGATPDANDWGPPADERRWETTQPTKQAQQGHWTSWGKEAGQLPKVNQVPPSFVGTRNDLSAQQQSEILQALLNHQNQGHDVRSAHDQFKGGQYGYGPTKDGNQQGGQQQGKKNKQQQQQQNNQGKKNKNKKNQQAQNQPKQRQNDAWGMGTDSGWGDGGWGMPEEDGYHDEYQDMDDRRVHFTPITSNLWGGSQHDSTYNMPSKTLAHAYQGTTTSLFTGAPRNKVSEEANVQFVDSKGAALKPVHQAIFGKTRMAKDRIHWMFSPNKDERVSSLLAWIEIMSHALGAYGLHRFLQSREKGALIANADYRPPQSPNEPAFDWLTFDQLQASRDRILQESVAFYDPAVTCIVFVFLPSKSGNSVAMWRRKISIGNNTRASRINEIHLAMAGLRREKDYIVHVDELPPKSSDAANTAVAPAAAKSSSHKHDYSRSYYPYETAVEKKPKKRKWWHFFRLDWD